MKLNIQMFADKDTYGVELKLETSKFKQALKDAQKEAEIRTGKIGASVSAIDFKNAGYEVKEVGKETAETRQQADKASRSFTGLFGNAGKDARRFILSLFSIRSIWSLISRSASAYLSTNDALSARVQNLSTTLGSFLAPVIKKVVDWAEYAVIAVAKLSDMLFNTHLMATLSSKSLNKQASSAKKLTKTLAGFDELTNINGDSTGLASGVTSDLDAFYDKVQKVSDYFDKWKDSGFVKGIQSVAKWFSALDSGSQLFVGGSGLALLTLLSGTGGILPTLTLLGTTVFTVTIAYESIKKAEKSATELTEAIKTQASPTKKTTELYNQWTNEIIKNTNAGVELTDQQKKQKDFLLKLNETYGLQTKSMSDNYMEMSKAKSIAELSTFGIYNLTNAGKEHQKALDAQNEKIAEQSELMAENTDKIVEMAKAGTLSKDEIKKATTTLEDNIKKLETQKDRMDKNSESYKTTTKNIKDMKENLKQLKNGNYDVKAKIEVDADTKKAGNKLSNFLGTIASVGSKALNAMGWDIGASALSSISKKLKSYDVGTNYVPNDQIALIHKGEMIVPKKYNPSTSGIGGGTEVVNAINTLIQVVQEKDMNAYISKDDIGKASVSYINEKQRQSGRSLV